MPAPTTSISVFSCVGRGLAIRRFLVQGMLINVYKTLSNPVDGRHLGGLVVRATEIDTSRCLLLARM
jgi:hypothetical protein